MVCARPRPPWPIEARHEVDLRPLDTTLRARGVRIAYPAIDADTNVMTFRFVDDVSQLDEKGFGFHEPAEGAPEAPAVDVMIVPAIAVDPTGHRIGDWQLVAEVPATEHDVRCQWVVTDVRTFDAFDPFA